MELLLKVGNTYPLSAPDNLYQRTWHDGQLVDIRPDGFHKGTRERKDFVVIQTPHDYWDLRGTRDWKATNQKVYDLKKFLSPVDKDGKYIWEKPTSIDLEKDLMKRNYFIDFKYLLDEKLINKATFDSIYNEERDHSPIYLDRDFTSYLFREEEHQRKKSFYSNHHGSITSGTYSIGTGQTYTTVTAFETAIGATLTGNLTGEHLNEETTIATAVIFTVNTSIYTLKLTAASGAEHDGGAYGNGARINFGTSDQLKFDEISAGTLDRLEVSNLALDISGSSNTGIYLSDGGGFNTCEVKRIVIKSDVNAGYGIYSYINWDHIKVNNCIIYDGETNAGIYAASSGTVQICNNTIINCGKGIWGRSTLGVSSVLKNNLIQACTIDYDSPTEFATTAKNISEDGTSPEAAYDNTDVHTNSVFKDYANKDFRLDLTGGDATNLAIVDDGDNLSDYFTDDIQGNTRNTWYIGASEGYTGVSGWTGKICGVTNPTKINGVAVADILKVCGIS